MKTKLLLWCVLIFASIYSWGQTMNEPFKKANTILIETKSPSKDIYLKWGKHLAQNGFIIENSDQTFLTLKTGLKKLSQYNNTSSIYNYNFFLFSSVNDSGTIMIKIRWSQGETIFHDWEYASNKLNVQNVIYLDIMKIINSFGSSDIKFQRN